MQNWAGSDVSMKRASVVLLWQSLLLPGHKSIILLGFLFGLLLLWLLYSQRLLICISFLDVNMAGVKLLVWNWLLPVEVLEMEVQNALLRLLARLWRNDKMIRGCFPFQLRDTKAVQLEIYSTRKQRNDTHDVKYLNKELDLHFSNTSACTRTVVRF